MKKTELSIKEIFYQSIILVKNNKKNILKAIIPYIIIAIFLIFMGFII